MEKLHTKQLCKGICEGETRVYRETYYRETGRDFFSKYRRNERRYGILGNKKKKNRAIVIRPRKELKLQSIVMSI